MRSRVTVVAVAWRPSEPPGMLLIEEEDCRVARTVGHGDCARCWVDDVASLCLGGWQWRH